MIFSILFLCIILFLSSDVTPERHAEVLTVVTLPLSPGYHPPLAQSQNEWPLIFEEEYSGNAWREKWNIQD